ncbi:MoaD/ThiS family protein [Glaciibacter superstes]|uniref:MoaD/ThiS family protein n=1 Tax=Glaciibacter superstes TaxID=501023 RepID=UPI001B7F95D5|nr:MoaD/ThiS family protein [Glaciibacter superstes]
MTSVRIRYFAAAADAAGREEEQLTLGAGATLGTLKQLLEERYGPAMQTVLASGSFLIDKVVRRDAAFPISGNVDVLPPFAGG